MTTQSTNSSSAIEGSPTYRRGQAKKAASVAVKSTREQLTSSSGVTLEFDNDMVIAHARNYQAASIVIPTLIMIAGGIAALWQEYPIVLAWIAAALFTHALLFIHNSRYLKTKDRSPGNVRRWRRRLIAGDFLTGIVWASYMLLPLHTDEPIQAIFTFSTMLIVIAVYSFTVAPFLISVILVTAPICGAMITSFFLYGTELHMAMGGLFLVAQLLFIMVARQVQNALLTVFRVKVEKDDLILDLEEAKAISEESRRRAEEANLAKSRFLATMSHELRTPLNAILGFSEIIKGEILGPVDNPSYKEYVTDIHSSGQHLLNLINEILDLSRIEAGKYKLAEEPVSLVEVVEDCNALIQLRAKSRGVEIENLTEVDLPRVWADERAIRQIVLNLLSNAVKFTPSGGKVTVTVGWTAGGGQYISVADTGPGIPKDEIPIVLSQFGQGSSAIKSAEQGTGLGLPIVQALINMHGGTFDLKSRLRVGTRVVISLPNTRVMKALAPIDPNPKSETAQPERPNIRRKPLVA